jgi:hypothetical protein
MRSHSLSAATSSPLERKCEIHSEIELGSVMTIYRILAPNRGITPPDDNARMPVCRSCLVTRSLHFTAIRSGVTAVLCSAYLSTCLSAPISEGRLFRNHCPETICAASDSVENKKAPEYLRVLCHTLSSDFHVVLCRNENLGFEREKSSARRSAGLLRMNLNRSSGCAHIIQIWLRTAPLFSGRDCDGRDVVTPLLLLIGNCWK